MRMFTPDEFDAHFADWRVVERATAELEAGAIAIDGDEVMLVRFPVRSWAWSLRRASQREALGPGVICIDVPQPVPAPA